MFLGGPRMVFGLCVLVLALVSPVRPQSAHFCGSMLVEALEIVCDLRFPDLKSSVNELYAAGNVGTGIGQDISRPWALKHSQFRITPARTFSYRYANDIVDTCCLNPCDYNTLTSYCKLY